MNNVIKERNNNIRTLLAEHETNKTRLKKAATWIRYTLIVYSINTVTSAQHQKKHGALIVNKTTTDGIKKNTNNVITNLTRFELTEDEVEVLHFGVKHNVLSRPKESEMVATVEYVWEQIDNNNILQENHMIKKEYKHSYSVQFTVKDSLDAANKIQEIPKKLFDSGYKFVSFNVILFTILPLAKTIDLILKPVYSEKLVTTNLTKQTMKKLLKDPCSKNTFTFNDKICKQIDGVSMESPLGLLLANAFMTELEKDIIQKLIDKMYIMFYILNVDDTLLLPKDEDRDPILKELNKNNNKTEFTVNCVINENMHFLDIKIHQNNTDKDMDLESNASQT